MPERQDDVPGRFTAGGTGFRLEVPVPGASPGRVFDLLIGELEMALPRRGYRLEPGAHGRILEVRSGHDPYEVARVLRWEPGRCVELEWRAADWAPSDPPVVVTYRLEAEGSGTRLSIEYANWDPEGALAGEGERVGWIASELLAPLVVATSPRRLGDWRTDRVARRPTGESARATYADPLYHRPNFRAILERLKLVPTDRLLEVGCGGGAFLQEALVSGCRALAIDHSPEMVRLARAQNRPAVEAGRLEVREADAAQLPFPDSLCTCAVTTGAFGFFDQPVQVLREIRRVLVPGGRLVLFTGTKELRGTPAAPEPVASRVHWYEDEELAALAREAGFADVVVERPAFGRYAREAGLPEDAVAFFDQVPTGQILQGRRPFG